MKEEKNSDLKDFMLDYLVSLWMMAKIFLGKRKSQPRSLLCRMKQGKIASYSQVEKN